MIEDITIRNKRNDKEAGKTIIDIPKGVEWFMNLWRQPKLKLKSEKN